MSRPYAGMGVAAAGSAAAFWATDLYASNLASLPGEAVTNLSAALSTLPSYIASHGPLPTAAPLALACGLAAGCGVWVAWANMVARRGNYRSGEEHGSARWATPRELRRLSDEASPDDNILLTQNVRLAMSRDDHDPRWERNRNVVVIGGSGSGKTRTYVEPNLMQMNASYLVTDPKGTTVRRLGGMLAAHGYDVRTLNTVDFSLSMRYNPLAYVRTQQDVLELVECLIVNTTPKGKSANDPFWENSERLLYCALIGYLTYHCPPEDRTLPGLMTLLSLAEARDEDESFMSPLDVLFRELETGCRCVAAPGAAGGDGRSMGGARESVRWVPWCDPATPDSDYALGRYRAFKAAAGKTLKSIIISCNARLSALAMKRASEHSGLDEFVFSGLTNCVSMWFGVLPTVMCIGTVALILTNYTPIFQILGTPFIPLLNLLQVPDAKAASATLIVGFADMFTPSVIIAGTSSIEMTRFIVAVISVTQVLFLDEVGGLILGSKLPINVLELFLIFLERTIISLFIVCPVAHLIF